ncbi:hypothetical protein [Stutzerimonas nitrititolerans]|uniref:Uncharacterized protein n=1 Tax=Stutzerimonas nitrititolerans TaxID=2482751 RepID=A0ABX9V3W5_9GAMM|nr:hypothetical protein [Stutzerimonas nitrititolerans]RMI00497.1 hypothetical protein EA795_13335 [Stutzerimonas nitrititolerans]
MASETGGPAFPCEGGNKFISGNEIRRTLPSSGMDLRDYFAAKAMQGWTANPLPNDSSIQEVAEWAYRQADAMLAARTK